MRRNRQAAQQAAQAEAAISEELKQEKAWLNRNAPTFGNVAPADYSERAKAFNAKMKEIGATTLTVVEG